MWASPSAARHWWVVWALSSDRCEGPTFGPVCWSVFSPSLVALVNFSLCRTVPLPASTTSLPSCFVNSQSTQTPGVQAFVRSLRGWVPSVPLLYWIRKCCKKPNTPDYCWLTDLVQIARMPCLWASGTLVVAAMKIKNRNRGQISL